MNKILILISLFEEEKLRSEKPLPSCCKCKCGACIFMGKSLSDQTVVSYIKWSGRSDVICK